MTASRLSAPVVAATRAELAEARRSLPGRVAVVMTMGALHEGHTRLIQVAREHADSVLVTIFVNPLQFAAGEDLQRYPRDLDADLAICTAERVEVVFAPDVGVMYPSGEEVDLVEAGDLGSRLEGEFRPTHFDGVLTVVAKLLELSTPIGGFGEKDAQQLELIRRMVAQQRRPVQVVAVGIVREPDGLALSSRNRYLGAEDRAAALVLSRALRAAPTTPTKARRLRCRRHAAVLAQVPAVDVDYLEMVDDETWLAPDEKTRTARILVAGHVGSTRLIDNVSVTLGTEARPDHAAG